jgi:hypothetical protein
VCTQIAKHINSFCNIQALTRRDSLATARTKRALMNSMSAREELWLDHVFSHLLDRNHGMTAEVHTHRMDEMRKSFGDRCLHVLEGNAHADQLAGSQKRARVCAQPLTSVNDPLYPAFMTTTKTDNDDDDDDDANAHTERIGEDIRRYVYTHQRNAQTAAHKQAQTRSRDEEPQTISLDHACRRDVPQHTDLRQSNVAVMRRWRTSPNKAATYNFLYRARRGALLEKAKAFHRIEAEKARNAEKPFFARSYGAKYACDTTCPCCQDADETDGHTLFACPHTSNQFRKNLREEVIEVLRKHVDERHAHKLEELPAWFACADDIVYRGNNELLQEIARYDRSLGALAYVPSALVAWLHTLKWQEAITVHSLLDIVQDLLIQRAHETWSERCKRFEEQWRAESKRRRADDEANAKRARDEEEAVRKKDEQEAKLRAHDARQSNAPQKRGRGRPRKSAAASQCGSSIDAPAHTHTPTHTPITTHPPNDRRVAATPAVLSIARTQPRAQSDDAAVRQQTQRPRNFCDDRHSRRP